MFKQAAKLWNERRDSSLIRRVLKENNVTKETVMGTAVMEDMLANLASRTSTGEAGKGCIDADVARSFLREIFAVMNVSFSKKDVEFIIERCQKDTIQFSLDEFLSLLRFSLPACR